MRPALIYIFFVTVCIVVFTGCPPTDSPGEAQLVTIDELRVTPGYTWLDPRIAEYKPDTAIVALINSAFNAGLNKYIIFCKPSCACEESQKPFPYLIKVLMEASVPDSCYQIYSMKSKSTSHPYMTNLVLMDIPEAFALKSGQPGYSIFDTLTNIKKNFPDSAVSVEQLLLYSLQ